MLNITENKITDLINLKDFRSYHLLKRGKIRRLSLYLLIGLLLTSFLCLFLPWTQNIRAKGYVTTRSPEQRPQMIPSILAGRIEKWFIQEGDFVHQGDTIVFISEVKGDYFDPNLLARTSEQIEAKSQSIDAYSNKITALQQQYKALQEALKLKRQQTRNKIEQAYNKISIDSIDLIAYEANLVIANNQQERTQKLYNEGLKSLTEVQEKKYKAQSAKAKADVQRNKLQNQRNALTGLHIELATVGQEYADKLAKSQSDQQSAISGKMESMAATAKLRNQYSNYFERQKYYYITAPQSGYITKTLKKGIGENVKEGAELVSIMPAQYDLATEVYLQPQDLPLIDIGKRVQLRFDGWPAIVISGWPKSSTGVFPGNVVAIDQFIGDNGLYRVIISPDKNAKIWPDRLRVGTGVRAFILLKEVPMWYEMWRQLNGFPPDFYQSTPSKKGGNEVKRKAPLKSVK